MNVTGAGLLLRQAVRRDRVLAGSCLTVFVAMAYASAYATGTLYDSPPERLAAIALINGQRGILALYGPIDVHAGVGALAMSKMTVLYALFAAGMFVALVRRHTRSEEESGRAELVAGTATGRNAPLAAAVAESAMIAVLLGSCCALAAVVGGLPARGSVYFGLSWVGTGLVATGVAAVCCQLSASARTCGVAAAGVLGGSYLVRAVGDATSLHWLDWLSPFGWNTQLHAWSAPRAWVVLLYPALAAVLLTAAQLLRAHRDLNAGMLAARPGAAHGSTHLRGPVALQLATHRTMLVIWSVAVFALCAFFGAIIPALDDVLRTVGGEQLAADLGGSLMVAILAELAVVASCFGVVVAGHAAAEELQGRAELTLATGQSRTRWFLAGAGLAIGGTAWLVVLAGLGMWLGYGLGGGPHPEHALEGAVVWIPATTLFGCLALALLAVRPTLTPLAWALPLGSWVLGVVAPLLHAPAWVAALSPYDHVPKVPVDAMAWTPEVLLSLLAGAVLLTALERFRTRDIG
ncbi:ABC transporter permease [Nocardioides ultimimeridianus]